MRLLKHIVNSDRRQYFIEEVNTPLWLDIITLGKRYPEPTHENVVHPNTHLLLDMQEQFFECWNVSRKVYEPLWRIVINKYEHSANWRNFLDWAILVVGKSGWKPLNPSRQMPLWKGDRKCLQ